MTLPDTPAPKVDGRPPTVARRPADAPSVPPAVDRETAPSQDRVPEPVVVQPAPVAPPVAAEPVAAELDPAPAVDPVVDVSDVVDHAGPDDPASDDAPLEVAPPDEPLAGVGPPPCPPFEPAAAPYRWQVQLPGTVAQTFTVRVGDDRIWVDGVDVPFASIVDVDLGIEKDKATVTRRRAASTYLNLTLSDGRVVTASARDVGRSGGRIESLVAAAAYLWEVLGAIPAIRAKRDIETKLRRGAEVTVGHVRITAIGVAWKRNPIVTWSRIGDPSIRGTDLVVPTDGDDPMVIPLDVDDAFMLPSLLVELRGTFS